ncbi:MAG: sensor histidine kinase [Anaerolineaceae bacterium]
MKNPQSPAQIQTKPLNKGAESLSTQSDQNSSEEINFLETELRITLEEIAHLNNALADARMKLAAIQRSGITASVPPSTDHSSIAELLNEMNPLIATIANYSDLLASQSVGPLGPLQIRFVERINRSVEQIHSIFLEYQSNLPAISQSDIEYQNHAALTEIIQTCISNKKGELQKKQITLQLLLPDHLPEVMGSNDDIAKIIELLLTNALQITPGQEIVRLSVNSETVDHGKLVNLSIRDSGPGIQTKLLPELITIHGDQTIPGCYLSRSQLVSLNELIQEQGGVLEITNSDEKGCIWKIQFLPIRD